MKIYTKKGDLGETSLVGGKRVKKNDPLLEAYGTIDELNASFGLIIAEEELPMLNTIQNQLFVVAGMLATEPEMRNKYWDEAKIDDYIKMLEEEIDRMSENLPPLKSFVLPQGSRLIAQTHLSRTICRRAERKIVLLAENNSRYNSILRFANRLSDYLFILARFFHYKCTISEKYWESER